jgi:hypothetical protein
MSPDEIDSFLAGERMCRAATVDGDGAPHVSPLWFVWDGTHLWLNSVVQSQRWANLMRDPRISVIVDGGVGYSELRGVELTGKVEPIGDVPRTSRPDPAVAEPERLWGEKYMDGAAFVADGGHAWLRLTPDKIVSWDFRKMQRA